MFLTVNLAFNVIFDINTQSFHSSHICPAIIFLIVYEIMDYSVDNMNALPKDFFTDYC